MKRAIYVYNTHIEVFPYERGENKSIEDFYSVYDPLFYKMNPVAYYVENNTLYLPRGTNVNLLERQFNTNLTAMIHESDPSKKIKIKPTLEPRSRIQSEAVEFLTGEGRFVSALNYSQQSLNLDTGDGKTIAMILAIAKKYKTRTILIVHQTKLKEQWMREFMKASTLTEDRFCDLVGTEAIVEATTNNIDADVFFVNHQTLHLCASKYGWDYIKKFFKKIKVGIKVYDEAHKYFSNIMMIDFFSNTKKTFYLTATFTRTQMKEKMIFKRAFANCYRFGEETMNYEEKRKHVIYYYVTYNSRPDPIIIPGMYNKYNISPFKYIDYALKDDERKTLLRVIETIMKQVENLRGRVLITSPKIESTEIVADYLRNITDKSISIINSSKTKEENDEARHADIISSTIKSLGTGIDISGLRVLINTEPFTSEDNMRQLKGRLREFSPTDDTFMFDIVDTGFNDISIMGEKRKKAMKRYAKEIRLLQL